MKSLESLPLRERKRIKTQIQLAKTALELFHQHGYDNVTVDDIADAVEISPRTFFRYYPAKEDVLFPNEADTVSLLRAALLARPADEPVLVAVKNGLLDIADDFQHRKEPLTVRNEIIANSPRLRSRALEQQARLEQVLTKTIAERMNTNPTSLAPRVIAATSIAGLRAAIDTWLETDTDQPLTQLAAKVLDRLDTGLRDFTG